MWFIIVKVADHLLAIHDEFDNVAFWPTEEEAEEFASTNMLCRAHEYSVYEF